MNTYNENLQSAVNKTLNALELEDKQLESKANAAKFTLYYAEGARITADDVLANDKVTYKDRSKVNIQAVINNNIATNMSESAETQKTEVEKAVGNIATAAANVEAANNAIIKLSSDVGGLLNIAMPADFKTEIHTQCEDASDLIRLTAYHSELASEYGMKASELTSEITANAVEERAKVTKTEIETLQKTAAEQFLATSKLIENDHQNISKARINEKVAEGMLVDSMTQYDSSVKAYKISNHELNYGLTVPKKSITDSGFKVYFNTLEPPFKFTKPTPNSEDKFYGVKMVESYKIMVVPVAKKMLFNLTSAEVALTNKGTFLDVPIVHGVKRYSVPISLDEIKDVDGNNLNLGDEYVVFLFIEINEDYKKLIHNFVNVLSVASSQFSIVHQLLGPKKDDISYDTSAKTISFTIDNVAKYTQDLFNDKKFIYRCILLQIDNNDIMGLMNKEDLKNIEDEIRQLEKIAEEYDPKIEELTGSINAIKSKGLALDQSIIDHEQKMKVNQQRINDLKNRQSSHGKEHSKLTKQQEKNSEKLKDLNDKLSDSIDAKNSATKNIKELERGITPFFFDLDIANMVNEANYLLKGDAELQKSIASPNDSNLKSISCTFKILDTTTDNFGNIFDEKNTYLPAILTASTALDSVQNQYANKLVIASSDKKIGPVQNPAN